MDNIPNSCQRSCMFWVGLMIGGTTAFSSSVCLLCSIYRCIIQPRNNRKIARLAIRKTVSDTLSTRSTADVPYGGNDDHAGAPTAHVSNLAAATDNSTHPSRRRSTSSSSGSRRRSGSDKQKHRRSRSNSSDRSNSAHATNNIPHMQRHAPELHMHHLHVAGPRACDWPPEFPAAAAPDALGLEVVESLKLSFAPAQPGDFEMTPKLKNSGSLSRSAGSVASSASGVYAVPSLTPLNRSNSRSIMSGAIDAIDAVDCEATCLDSRQDADLSATSASGKGVDNIINDTCTRTSSMHSTYLTQRNSVSMYGQHLGVFDIAASAWNTMDSRDNVMLSPVSSVTRTRTRTHSTDVTEEMSETHPRHGGYEREFRDYVEPSRSPQSSKSTSVNNIEVRVHPESAYETPRCAQKDGSIKMMTEEEVEMLESRLVDNRMAVANDGIIGRSTETMSGFCVETEASTENVTGGTATEREIGEGSGGTETGFGGCDSSGIF